MMRLAVDSSVHRRMAQQSTNDHPWLCAWWAWIFAGAAIFAAPIPEAFSM